ncbi:MAG: hypothetical protein KC464_23950, partial [Myxococcales bacterium]|nr:hypothetical protein [Myxococcales bacterium]
MATSSWCPATTRRPPSPSDVTETIAAIATPRGAGGVAIVRLSGPDAVAIAAALVGRPPAALADRRLSAGVA